MKQEEFKNIVSRIERTGYHPTLGYAITEEQFEIIAETAAKHIHKHGWLKYLEHMEHWRLKIYIFS